MESDTCSFTSALSYSQTDAHVTRPDGAFGSVNVLALDGRLTVHKSSLCECTFDKAIYLYGDVLKVALVEDWIVGRPA